MFDHHHKSVRALLHGQLDIFDELISLNADAPREPKGVDNTQEGTSTTDPSNSEQGVGNKKDPTGGRKAIMMARNAALLGWVSLPLASPPQMAGRVGGECAANGELFRPSSPGGGDKRLRTARNDILGGESDAFRTIHGAQSEAGVIGDSSDAVVRICGGDVPRARGGGKGGEEEAAGEATVPHAIPGHVWFHAPSAKLVTELPENWVAFSHVSGGILADVSPPLWQYRK